MTRPRFANNRALGNDSPGKNAPEPTVVFGTLNEALIGIAKEEAEKVIKVRPDGSAIVPRGPISGVPNSAEVQKIMCRCGWRGDTIEGFNGHNCEGEA